MKKYQNCRAMRLITLKKISALAWEYGATYFLDSPMNSFAKKLQAIINEADAETVIESEQPA